MKYVAPSMALPASFWALPARDGHLAKNSDARSGPPPKSFILIPLTKNKCQKLKKKKNSMGNWA